MRQQLTSLRSIRCSRAVLYQCKDKFTLSAITRMVNKECPERQVITQDLELRLPVFHNLRNAITLVNSAESTVNIFCKHQQLYCIQNLSNADIFDFYLFPSVAEFLEDLCANTCKTIVMLHRQPV